MNLDMYRTKKSVYQVAQLRVVSSKGVEVMICCIKLPEGDTKLGGNLPKDRYSSVDEAQEYLNDWADRRGFRWCGRNSGLPVLTGKPGNLEIICEIYDK